MKLREIWTGDVTEFIRLRIYFINGISEKSSVVRVSGYRSRGPSSIPGTTKFSEK
jgi:hypothetical protein